MIAEKEFKAYVEMLAGRASWEWTAETACLLNGAWSLYEAAGWEAGRTAVANAMKQLKKEASAGAALSYAAAGCGTMMFRLDREQTAEVQSAADTIFQWLTRQSRPDQGSPRWEQELYLAEPFYLEYENTFHAKEQYNRVQEELRAAARLAESRQGEGRLQEGWYLMAMIDCCGLISEEVFDHYKNVEGYYKAGLCRAAADEPGVAYAILKGCRLGALLPEKHEEKGIQLLDSARELSGEQAGILLMAYGEYVRLCPGGEEK